MGYDCFSAGSASGFWGRCWVETVLEQDSHLGKVSDGDGTIISNLVLELERQQLRAPHPTSTPLIKDSIVRI